MRNYERTRNGIEYIDELAGCDGATFILFPGPEHTSEMIKEAVRELFNERDVVGMKIADAADRDARYRTEIYAHPFVRPLRWYEINADDPELLRREREKGTTVLEYIQKFVLPLTEATKTANIARRGKDILER